ncbi:DUF4232 domain-containing protein [Actinocorallia sp. API 0066]|uniref:DUF4232 domain-containing protein n=1 Tax=Actinocorallia sp. API 0066 TaxID=2896846 RepID=UPI001E325F05|nr:DUF4232 domain-containing protein [Actinocorallia sp. API 0066]MCD0450020.1 DUF4232 domain-containing protein [Actinocorallia sp. API 0066]
MGFTRAFVVGVSVVALTAGCGELTAGAPVRPTASPATETPPPCPPSGFQLREGGANAAMGLRVVQIDLHNCGTEPITLNGYPELTLLDAQGAELKVDVGHGSNGVATVEAFDVPPKPVTVARRSTASASILWRNLVEGGESLRADRVVVTPAPKLEPRRVDGLNIDLGTTRKVGVSPWTLTHVPQTGDGAPHHAENNGWKQRRDLTPAQQAVGEAAATRFRPVLDKLHKNGDITPNSVHKALLAAGAEPDRLFVSPLRASAATDAPPPPGAVIDYRPDDGICVTGSVTETAVDLQVSGPNGEGTCIEAFAH